MQHDDGDDKAGDVSQDGHVHLSCTDNLHHSSKVIKAPQKEEKKGPVSFGPARGLTWLPWKQSGTSE